MIAVDTSVVVAAFASWHEGHASAATLARRPRVPAHVLLETYSVLTRLPPPHRAPARLVAEFLAERFSAQPLVLPGVEHARLIERAAEAGIVGGEDPRRARRGDGTSRGRPAADPRPTRGPDVRASGRWIRAHRLTMSWIVTSLRENPELAIFLTLAIGFVIGRVRIGSFRLGNVVGTLLAGVLVGQLDVKIDPLVKTVFFSLFLFATGYKVGTSSSRPPEERGFPGAPDARPVRGEPGDDGGGRAGHGVRLRHRGGAPGRGLYRVHGHRHGGEHDLAARTAGGRDDPAPEQHPRRLRGQLPRRHELRGLVPLVPRAAAAPCRPEG